MVKVTSMDENEKMEALKVEAAKHGFYLSKDAAKVVNAMFKKEKKNGGLYCPCKNIAIYPDDEKKDYICPCKTFAADVESDGECFCGLFVKDDPGMERPSAGQAK